MKKRFLAIFIVVMMLFSQITVFASDLDSTTTSINPEDKLTDELKEVMSNTADDEYISISVWLYEMDDSYVYNTISEHYGVEINQNNENAFLQKQVNDKTEKFYSITSKNEMTMQTSEITIQSNDQITNEINAIRNNSIVNDTISDNDLREFIQSGKDISELIARSEQNAYMKEWRNARKNINTSINTSFESSLDLSKCKDVYIDSLIGYATLEVKNSYILTFASYPLVQKVDLFDEKNTKLVDLTDETSVESATEPFGYHMFQSKLPNGYTGENVTIGVLEVTDDDDATYVVHYDSNNVHLANKTNIVTRLDPDMSTNKVSTTEFDRHATAVLTVLCGNPIESTDVIVYQGIAPDADVFYTNVFSDLNSICDGILWLIEQNVHVINMSAGLENNSYYNAWDNYFDCIVQQYKITIIVAGGNFGGSISHPGHAYNVITVGYTTMNKSEDGKYITNEDSAYEESNANTNKPDIVAFGTNIYSLDSNRNPNCIYEIESDGDIVYTSGSSVAAPMVTGTVALMLQKNPLLGNNPNEIKAILVASANDEEVGDEPTYEINNDGSETVTINNPLDCENPFENTTYVNATGIIRDKTGAGILNIKNSVENSAGAILWSYTFSSDEISTDTSRATEEYYFVKNTKFKLGLIFDKNDHNLVSTSKIYGNDINIEMIDAQTNEVVFRSRPNTSDTSAEVISSRVNNVELFDIEVKKTGNYRFRIYFKGEDIYDSTGATIPPYHKNAHTSLNATIVIACSCLETNITENETEPSSGYYYKVHSCGGNGCIYNAYEKIYVSTCQDNISVGCVVYKMEYQVVYVNNNREFLYEDFTITCNLNDTSRTYMIRLSGKDTEYTALGYIETIRYETYVFNSSGALHNIYETDVKVEYDNMTCLIYVYN